MDEPAFANSINLIRNHSFICPYIGNDLVSMNLIKYEALWHHVGIIKLRCVRRDINQYDQIYSES